MMFGFTRPKYKIGMLVRVNFAGRRICMLLKNRVKLRPKGTTKKQWVYDGIIMEIQRIDKEIEVSAWSYITTVLESDIHSVIA